MSEPTKFPFQQQYLQRLRANDEEYEAARNRKRPVCSAPKEVKSRYRCPLCGSKRCGLRRNECRDCGAQMRVFS